VAADCTATPDFTLCNVDTTASDGADRSYDVCMGGSCVSPGCGMFTCNVSGPSFRLPDTGQIQCFDDTTEINCPRNVADCAATPFCGQDAQYGADVASPSVRWNRSEPVAGEPIVTDNVTGLIWQGCVLGRTGSSCEVGTAALNQWVDIRLYCDQLAWGGSSNWRFPDHYELYSLVHLGPSSTARFDTTAFPSMDGDVWANGMNTQDNLYAWLVSFLAGEIHVAFGNSRMAMCVQTGAVTASRPTARFDRAGTSEVVVRDAVTGLQWQGCEVGLSGAACDTGTSTMTTWSDALATCEALAWGGSGDWRLPSTFELYSIIDTRAYAPATSSVAFPATSSVLDWTSTTNGAGPTEAFVVDFAVGGLFPRAKTEPHAVRCVSGS